MHKGASATKTGKDSNAITGVTNRARAAGGPGQGRGGWPYNLHERNKLIFHYDFLSLGRSRQGTKTETGAFARGGKKEYTEQEIYAGWGVLAGVSQEEK